MFRETTQILAHRRCIHRDNVIVITEADPPLESCDPSYKTTCTMHTLTPCSRPRGVGTFVVKYDCPSIRTIVCLEDCCCQRFPRK